MRDKMTMADFGWKVEYEGGLFDAILSYGLDETYLNRSEDPELYDLIQEFAERARELEPLVAEIEDALDDYKDASPEE